ncbi:branched-chain amino acid aminotransferase [Aliiroseovarius crassostreae]|uniref:branched-chain amino acid aminotransferase n=1 Tax=Aliiroseovarius crassostreae TaxID=154981 RepID=UPI0022069E34|nr:branched-chain amino acid aminotransferase [Aliiroseovarius crassostreae]UWQ07249.1 branched-chain amino acid aminotransferase [Aliiroseovarius crassostreae]UWQ10358.1 branched-chain amino acid aminotransferase [Aliiroseovarius crassostreae]
MTLGTHIRTYFNGSWHEGDLPVMKAADHGSWLGSTVFDGARFAHGLAPDLRAHCDRVNRSAKALMITPTVPTEEMVAIVRDGLSAFTPEQPVYIRPMYWGLDCGPLGIMPKENSTGFAISLEQVPLAPEDATTTLTTTRFRRPVLESAVVNAKAGCLYPNNARMIAEAQAKGYGNALVADALGNVAETASSNVFMVRDGVVFTPVPNGTFLAGITRARHIRNLRADGVTVHECTLTFDDFRAADEVFLTGNMHKITPVTEFDGTHYQRGPITQRARKLYWDWAHSEDGRAS